ncbi:MAG: dehydratase [Solirubrobacterales bacterium]|nr:dehydratase [Solirubrobacterales bacterium]
MEAATQAWKTDSIGVWSAPVTFAVERERIAAYAEATNDTQPAHAAGDLAPPVFAIVPAFEALLPTLTAPVPQEILMRGVHGQQDFRYHQPIRPGVVLTSRAMCIGVTQRSTGAVVLGKAETRDEAGELVVEQLMTYFVRGGEFGESVGDALPEHAFPPALAGTEPFASVAHGYDADTTLRYSKASGDPMPIHLDDAFAKQMGLPGIIVHGLCTMAYTSRAVVGECCPEDPSRLKRLAVRFSSIVQPTETVTTALWRDGQSPEGHDRVVFETTSSTGAVAIKDGLAEIAS